MGPADALGAGDQVGLVSPDRQYPSQRNPTIMSTSQFAVIVGIVLGVVAVFAGVVPFVIVLLFAAAGLVIGRMLEGTLDLKSLAGSLAGRSTERR
jgi:hypothetical protein